MTIGNINVTAESCADSDNFLKIYRAPTWPSMAVGGRAPAAPGSGLADCKGEARPRASAATWEIIVARRRH